MFNNLLDWNPQFFREIKGRVKKRNVVIASIAAVITQLLIVVCFLGELPDIDVLGETQYSRYCFSFYKAYSRPYLCETDRLGEWVINWQLLWLDIFICLSIISIFSLLVVGTYMLIADLSKEESKGTLNFIRLTPQPATSILTGKILGVPIMLYGVILLVLPLHFAAGLNAHIPVSLIFGFYATTIASCAFFYSAATLWSQLNFAPAGFKPWLGSGAVLFFLIVATGVAMNSHSVSRTVFDWILIFYPGRVLTYLVDATYLSHKTVDYFHANGLTSLLFYGQSWWVKPGMGIGLILGNYMLWTYWLWQGIQRRFHNPTNTILSKEQSYWLTGWFVAISLGFTLQTTRNYHLFHNFILLQCFLLALFLGLIAALSPHRQTLHDWARYRHQLGKEGNKLWKELIFGEKSPSTVAIAINITIATIYILPSLFLFPFKGDASYALYGLLMSASVILLYAVIAQLILCLKSPKRAIWASTSILALMIVPFVCLALAEASVGDATLVWLFTFLPTAALQHASISTVMIAILGQWLAIALVGFQMTRQLRQAGASETKMLFSNQG